MPKESKLTGSQYICDKYVKDEVEFLSTDKRQMFLQSDTIILRVYGQAYPYYWKYKVCYFSATY